MGQFEKTLVKTSWWRGPHVGDGTLVATYREESQLRKQSFVSDDLVVALSLAQFPKRTAPQEIRVTVEWTQSTDEPLNPNQ